MHNPNPLIPAGYDVLWTVVVVAFAVVVILALVSIGRAASRMSPLVTLGWALVVIFLPLVGPLAWFAAGRRAVMAAGVTGPR